MTDTAILSPTLTIRTWFLYRFMNITYQGQKVTGITQTVPVQVDRDRCNIELEDGTVVTNVPLTASLTISGDLK